MMFFIRGTRPLGFYFEEASDFDLTSIIDSVTTDLLLS